MRMVARIEEARGGGFEAGYTIERDAAAATVQAETDSGRFDTREGARAWIEGVAADLAVPAGAIRWEPPPDRR